MTEKDQLWYLINGVLDGAYDIKTFCSEFTKIYDLEVAYEQLSEQENNVFGDLCEMAGRFSNDKEELKIPNMYYSKENILDKARYVKQKLENKKEIRLMLDYGCYPIWIYDENGNFVDNNLIDEIEKDDGMVAMLEELQKEFDALYLNNQEEFKYIGFPSEMDKQRFIAKVQRIYCGLRDLLGGKYTVKNMVNIWIM